MQIPDLQQYKDKFSQEAFTDKIARIAKRSGAKLVYAALVLYYTLQSDNVSLKDKAIIVGALGYLISPIDVIPDAIPIAGLTDDLSVLIYVINKVWNNVGDDVKQKAHEKLKTWCWPYHHPSSRSRCRRLFGLSCQASFRGHPRSLSRMSRVCLERQDFGKRTP